MTPEQLSDRVDAIAAARAKTAQGADYSAIIEQVALEAGVDRSDVADACAEAWAPMGAV